MVAKDIKLTDEGDLLIVNGDFVIAESDKQHIADIINSNKGWWKEYPELGVCISSYLSSINKIQEGERNIKLQLQSDGYVVNKAKLTQVGQESMVIDTDAERL